MQLPLHCIFFLSLSQCVEVSWDSPAWLNYLYYLDGLVLKGLKLMILHSMHTLTSRAHKYEQVRHTIHIHSAPYLILHDIYYMYVHWIKAELSHLLSLFASSFCLFSGWIYSSNGYCIIGVIWEGYWVLSASLLSFLSLLRTREDQTVPGRICVTEQESTLQIISTVNSSETERQRKRQRKRQRQREREEYYYRDMYMQCITCSTCVCTLSNLHEHVNEHCSLSLSLMLELLSSDQYWSWCTG